MITADQLVAHAIGDYVLQSDWMASKKRASTIAALVHAHVYTLPFVPLLVGHSIWALLLVIWSHFLIDRFGLARYVVWAKNYLAPRWLPNPDVNADGLLIGKPLLVRNLPWGYCVGNGYPPDRPIWLAVWLLIIADNILHVLINGLALRFL